MKKFSVFIFVLLFIFSGISAECTGDNAIKVLYKGKNIEFDVNAYYSNGRIMAPVRAIHEAMGAQVSWSDETQSATSSLNGVCLTMTLGESKYSLNGIEYFMDSQVEMVNGRIFAPVRYVAEGFGKKISYHENSQSAVISNDNEYSWVKGLAIPVPDFSWVKNASFVSETILSDGSVEYTYYAGENSLSDYLNYLQEDFGFEPYSMQYILGGTNYGYIKGDMLIDITEHTANGETTVIKIVPDVYRKFAVSKNLPQNDVTNKNDNKDIVADDSYIPSVPEEEKERQSGRDAAYDDIDYGKITKSELVEEYTSGGKTFYVYSYDMFSQSYYERYIESQGWTFYDFKFDIDTFSNSKYWVKEERVLCVSVSHIYNIVMISVFE
ncbi:MAG: copper amine oxidase N-terminal domain-containing protein [Clostridia bacterium]|nr:copper amine oxidase N-terminal domain-containing protein [Clostridia bacterium]